MSGNVMVARLAAPPQPLKFRDSLYWRDVVEARKDGIARVLLGGKTTVTVRELSRLELREEAQADGVRYTVELLAGKVRTSVARVLMRPGEQVEVRTRNAVASVRGTDFIVETVERPTPGGAFGLLGVREVGEGIREGGAPPAETVVVTLSGVVEVTNRLGGMGRAERLGAYEAARISARGEPARFQVKGDEVGTVLTGLTPPRAKEIRSGDKAESVGSKVEQVALAASVQRAKVFEQARGGGRLRAGSSGTPPSASGGPLAVGQGADEDDERAKSSSPAKKAPSGATSAFTSTSVSREGDDDDGRKKSGSSNKPDPKPPSKNVHSPAPSSAAASSSGSSPAVTFPPVAPGSPSVSAGKERDSDDGPKAVIGSNPSSALALGQGSGPSKSGSDGGNPKLEKPDKGLVPAVSASGTVLNGAGGGPGNGKGPAASVAPAVPASTATSAAPPVPPALAAPSSAPAPNSHGVSHGNGLTGGKVGGKSSLPKGNGGNKQ